MSINIGDDVTINATVVAITTAGNPVIKLQSGNRFLIKESDINTVRPQVIVGEADMREGN